MHTTTIIGSRGEELAAQWLSRHGFRLLHRNWRSGSYELDIVASKSGVLHFIEVKTRKKDGLTPPEQAIHAHKSRSLLHAAKAYLDCCPFDGEIQFDLVAVDTTASGHDIRYIEHIIEPHW